MKNSYKCLNIRGFLHDVVRKILKLKISLVIMSTALVKFFELKYVVRTRNIKKKFLQLQK